MGRRRATTLLLLVIALSGVFRWWTRSEFNYNMDSYNYMLGARMLARTGHLSGQLGPCGYFFCPHPKWLYKWGYIYFLSPFSLAGDQEGTARWTGLFLSLTGIYFAYRIARSLGAKREGSLLVACLSAGSYHSMTWSTEIISDNLGVTLLLASLFFLLEGTKRRPSWLLCSAGLLGAGVLVRNEYVVLALPWTTHVLLSPKARSKWLLVLAAGVVGCVLLGAGIGFAAWDLRGMTPVRYWTGASSRGLILPEAFRSLYVGQSLPKYAISEPGLWGLATLGMAGCVRKKDKLLGLISLSMILMIMVYMSFHNQQVRYYYHISPFLLLLASRCVEMFPGGDTFSGVQRRLSRPKVVVGFVAFCLILQVGIRAHKGRSLPGFEKEEALTIRNVLERDGLLKADLLITRNWRAGHFYTGISTQPFQFENGRVACIENCSEQAVILLVINDYLRHAMEEIEPIVRSTEGIEEIVSFEVEATRQPWYRFTNPRTVVFRTDPKGVFALRERLMDVNLP